MAIPHTFTLQELAMNTPSDDTSLIAHLRAHFPNMSDEALMRLSRIKRPDGVEHHNRQSMQPDTPTATAASDVDADLDLIDVVRQAIAVRKQQGLTQRAFAAELGINVRTLQEWERGRRCPTQAARTLLQRHVEAHN
jgi:DNA-binding transcriptional regulator YiaG